MMGTGLAAQPLPQTEPIRQKAKPAQDATQDATDKEFTPSSCFDGPRPGQVFKHGSQGLGYYRDQNAVAATRSGGLHGNGQGYGQPPPNCYAPPGALGAGWLIQTKDTEGCWICCCFSFFLP